MAVRLQRSEWLEGDPAGNDATPTPRDNPRPAPESFSVALPDLPHHPRSLIPPPGEEGRPLPNEGSQRPVELAALRSQLITGRELARRQHEEERPALFPTACPELDRLLAGGLPRGHLVELVGGRSSGRFALVLTLLAAVTGAGEVAAFVDLGDGLDPETAAAAGVDLERLLWLRPHHLRQALLGAEMLTTTGFPLVALDLGVPPVPHGRIAAPSAQAAWLRLARTASSHRTAILLSSPYRTSGAAASEVLDVRAAATRRSDPVPSGRLGRGRASGRGEPPAARPPELFLGVQARITLEKARRRPAEESVSPGAAPGAVESLTLSFVDGLLDPPRQAGPQARPLAGPYEPIVSIEPLRPAAWRRRAAGAPEPAPLAAASSF